MCHKVQNLSYDQLLPCTLHALQMLWRSTLFRFFPPFRPFPPSHQNGNNWSGFADNQDFDQPRLKPLQVWGRILLLCHPFDGPGDPQPQDCCGGEPAEGGPVLLPLLPPLPPCALLEGRDRDLPLPVHGRPLHDHPNHPLQPLLFSHLAWGSTTCLQRDRWTGFNYN